jgi:hypothetical protein
MAQPTHQPDAVLTLRVTPALRARLGELLERVPDTGAARLSRHGLAVWCLERGLLEAEAEPALVLRAPGRASSPSKPSVAPVAEPSTPSKPSPSRKKRPKPTPSSSPSSKTSTSPPTTPSSSPSGDDSDALRARWRALVTVQGQGAKAAGVSQPWVSRWLAGEKTGSPETLARIAAYLDALAAAG